MAKRSDIIEAFLEDCQALAFLRRERNLTRVAELLKVSRQRLQTRLERLQNHFNEPIYNEDFELMGVGQPLAEIGLIVEELKDRTKPNQVKVGCTIGVHHFILEDIVLEFETKNTPHISVIRMGGSKQELPGMLREGQIVLAIFDPDDERPEGLVSRPLWEVEYYAIIPKSFTVLAAKAEQSLKMEDFAKVPLIVSQRSSSRILQAFKQRKIALNKLRIVLKTQNYAARVEFANQGKAVTFVPSYQLFNPRGYTKVNHEKVTVKNVSHLIENRSYFLFWDSDRPLSTADEKFVEFLYGWEPNIGGVKRVRQ